jgi:glutathione S-transferase
MKVLQACSGEETHAVWTGTIKRLIHRYLEDRNKRRAFWRGSSENRIVERYEGRRWCDATQRELIDDITNIHGSHL